MTDFDSVRIYANLAGTWTDISSYVLTRQAIELDWGISGDQPTDLIADVGTLKFTLNNSGGEFYPDGGSALAGWDANIPIKIVFAYDGIEYTRFRGPIARGGLSLKYNGDIGVSTVDVSVVDWMDYAINTPIVAPDVLEDTTADVALQALVNQMPIVLGVSGDTGDYTMPAFFDGTKTGTTAYNEMVKIANSESPGRIYLVKNQTSGQSLVFENASHRDSSSAQKSTYTLAQDYTKNHSSGRTKNHSDGYTKAHTYTESDGALVTINSDYAGVELDYGGNIINYAKAIASPKRKDTNIQVLYRLPSARFIADGGTITWRGKYVDPEGGRDVNAIVSSMLEPEAPGGTDSTLVNLMNFNNSGQYVDNTGRHTWVDGGDMEDRNEAYVDGTTVTRLTGGIQGRYAVFGGYSAYSLTSANSTDFDFPGAFTIGWWEARFDATSNDATMARKYNTSKPGYLLGLSNSADLLVFMSSDGANWDIANGEILGQIKIGTWVYYEVSGDDDGFYYTFADGVLQSKWYSALRPTTTSGSFSIGLWNTSVYTYMAFDGFFIRKGVCLHRADFEPPKRYTNPTSDGDYLMNTTEIGSGSDVSSSLALSAAYESEAVTYTATNNSGGDAYIIHAQARGRGIYSYDKIEYVSEDATSQSAYGVHGITVDQPYQQDLAAGKVWMDAIISAEKDPYTKLKSISFWANTSATNILRFLQCDIGDKIRVTLSDPGIDGYYHIQNVKVRLISGVLAFVTWGVVPGVEPA